MGLAALTVAAAVVGAIQSGRPQSAEAFAPSVGLSGMNASSSPSVSATTVPSTATTAPSTATSLAPVDGLPEVIFNCLGYLPTGRVIATEPIRTFMSCATAGLSVQNATWTSWTPTTARGSGTVWANNCAPNCAAGTFSAYPATIILSGVTLAGASGPLFSRLTVEYLGRPLEEATGQVMSHFTLAVNVDEALPPGSATTS